jgi:hypothetical protein
MELDKKAGDEVWLLTDDEDTRVVRAVITRVEDYGYDLTGEWSTGECTCNAKGISMRWGFLGWATQAHIDKQLADDRARAFVKGANEALGRIRIRRIVDNALGKYVTQPDVESTQEAIDKLKQLIAAYEGGQS